MLALFLAKSLDNFHCAQNFGNHRADICHPVLTGPGNIGQFPADKNDRQDDHRNGKQQPGGQRWGKGEQIDDSADADDDIAQGHRHGGSDHLFDNCGIGGHARGHFRWPVFFKKARSQPQQIVLYREPQVGDDPLAQPTDKIETEGRRDSQNRDYSQKALKIGSDIAASSHKAFVDDSFEARRYR